MHTYSQPTLLLCASQIGYAHWTIIQTQLHTQCCHRVTGAAEFRLGILARHGDLIAILHNDITAERVKEEVEAAIGQPDTAHGAQLKTGVHAKPPCVYVFAEDFRSSFHLACALQIERDRTTQTAKRVSTTCFSIRL